jgi:uncharacterized membrane protein (DUF2068 family)
VRLSGALRTIALVEAAKGALVLVAGLGLAAMVHQDVQQLAERLVLHTHLNPAARYPRIFIELAGNLTDRRLLLIAGGAALYSAVRFVEAYGLWHARAWAEWFAAASGAVYVPFELIELYERVTWIVLGALIINLAIVATMLYSRLFQSSPVARR